MSDLPRITALKIAAILSFALGLAALIGTLSLLPRGADAINAAADAPPFEILVIGFVSAILRIAGAGGAWRGKRWGIVLTIVTNALDGIAAVPGILFAPTTGLWFSAIMTVLLGIVIIILCLWRDGKQADAR